MLKQFAGVAMVRGLAIPLALAVSVLLARLLGVDAFGQYSFYMAIVPLLALPVSGGLPQLLTREVAGYVHQQAWTLCKGLLLAAVAWVVLATVLELVLVVPVTILSGDDSAMLALMLMALAVLVGLNAVYEGSMRGLKAPGLASIPEQVIKPLAVAGMLVLLLTDGAVTVRSALLAQLLAAIIALFLAVVLFARVRPRDMISGRARFQAETWFRGAVPFTLMALVYTLGTNVGLLFLGWLGNEADVAALRVADRGVQLVALPLVLVNMVVAPHFVELWKQRKREELQLLSRKSALGAASLALPVALVFVFLGDWIVALVFGQAYAEIVYLPLVILSLGQLVNVAFGSVGTLLSMSGHERHTLIGQTLALVINVVLCLILIPYFGAVGGAIAVSAGLVCWNLYLALMVVRYLQIRPGPV